MRGKHGKIGTSLTKHDLTLAEDGRPQTMHYFTRDTDPPLTLGLLVDTSMSQRRVLDQEPVASPSFLIRWCAPTKTAFIIQLDREVELLQDLSSSPEQLQPALASLTTPQFGRTSGGDPHEGWERDRGSGRHHAGGGTLLYDALYPASTELRETQRGRKGPVLSDGVDRGTKESGRAASAPVAANRTRPQRRRSGLGLLPA